MDIFSISDIFSSGRGDGGEPSGNPQNFNVFHEKIEFLQKQRPSALKNFGIVGVYPFDWEIGR